MFPVSTRRRRRCKHAPMLFTGFLAVFILLWPARCRGGGATAEDLRYKTLNLRGEELESLRPYLEEFLLYSTHQMSYVRSYVRSGKEWADFSTDDLLQWPHLDGGVEDPYAERGGEYYEFHWEQDWAWALKALEDGILDDTVVHPDDMRFNRVDLATRYRLSLMPKEDKEKVRRQFYKRYEKIIENDRKTFFMTGRSSAGPADYVEPTLRFPIRSERRRLGSNRFENLFGQNIVTDAIGSVGAELRRKLDMAGVRDYDVPARLWKLPEEQMRKEVETYLASGGNEVAGKLGQRKRRWSERLVLEEFFVGINRPNAMQNLVHIDGWTGPSIVCEWEGVTCGEVNDGIAGSGYHSKMPDFERGDVVPKECCFEGEEAGADQVEVLCEEGQDKFITRESRDMRNMAWKNESMIVYCPNDRRLDPYDDVVTMIDIQSRGLQGTITKFIGDLQYLRRLNLFDNEISSTIPTEFRHLNSLEYLDLGKNSLTGIIPEDIDKWSDTLQELWLESNDFSGTLPMSLGKLRALEFIDLSNNNLKGPLLEDFFRMVNLRYLKLAGNHFSQSIPHIDVTPWPSHMRKANAKGEIKLKDISDKALRLQWLDLSSNDLVGSVSPKMLEGSPALRELSLAYNRLDIDGAFPIEALRKLEKLEVLDLSGNRFTSSIVGGDNLRCPNLRHLTLAHCHIEGPLPEILFEQLGKASAVYTLDLSQNRFTGAIPTALKHLSFLQKLDLSNNRLTGTIPEVFALFAGLVEFNATGNALTGKVPEDLCNRMQQPCCDCVLCPSGTWHPDGASNFRGACRKCPDHTDVGPFLGQTHCPSESAFQFGDYNGDGHLDESEVLQLLWKSTSGFFWSSDFDDWTKFSTTTTDASPDHCKLTGVTCNANNKVVMLQLSGAGLCSDDQEDEHSIISFCWGLPREINALEKLESIDLHGNRFFHGTIPESVADLKETLTFLDASKCPLQQELHSGILQLSNLEVLNLSASRLRGTIGTEIGSLANLKLLNLSLNPEFGGQLPDEIANLQNLEELFFSRSHLSGTIPALNSMVYLQNLELYGNVLEGVIPDLSNNKNLKRIDVFNNKLSGTFPRSLGTLPDLQIVSLKKNHFSGTLPSELGNLSMLHWLDVSLNRFSGTVPASLGALANLRDLHLGGNKLREPIPSALCSNSVINDGLTSKWGCDAILCSIGKWSSDGYAKSLETGCSPCPKQETTQYLGSIECRTFSQRDLLSILYDAVGGESWPEISRRGWKDPKISECEWEGVTCDGEGEVSDLSFPVVGMAGTLTDGGSNAGLVELHASHLIDIV